MTLLEFCESFFPEEEIFSERDGRITADICTLADLQEERKDKDPRLTYSSVKPTKVLAIVEPGNWECYAECGWCSSEEGRRRWSGPREITLSEENTRIMKRCRLVIDPEVAGIELKAKYPYFRVRGKPLTEKQAFDILCRTDCGWSGGVKLEDDGPYSYTLGNHWFRVSPLCPQGWVRPNGVVGMNSHIMIKFPYEYEIVDDILPMMLAFPYLDLMIGITDWDQAPDYARDDYFGEDYPDFEEHIVYGIWLHDGTLELMAPARAREKYAEYRRLYSGPNEDIYKEHYYDRKNEHPLPADLEYLKRCIRSHGLDPEEVLDGYEWDPVRGLRDPKSIELERAQQRAERRKKLEQAAEIKWRKLMEQLPAPTQEAGGSSRERIIRMFELGWSTLPEQALVLKREAQELMREAGVPDWEQVGVCHQFVPGGPFTMNPGAKDWPDPPAECIKGYAGDSLSEELQKKLFGLLIRMKREWESARGAGGKS